jgi:hypothetical protein
VTLTDEFEGVRTGGAELDDGLVMGRYRLGRRLGAGGFGAVHEAVDERLNRWVAVKVLHAEGAAPERVRREAVAAARLDHPGIVAVFDAGEEDGARYLVSELVEGRTLAQLEQAGELSDRDVLRIGLALTDALEHAHERGVVHRDVKPQNVLVPNRHKSWRGAAKLADFGVAMLAGDDPLTMTGDVVGTLAYMAPEQAAGRRVDARADLYAVALVLYEALAGGNPMRGANPADTARRVGGPVPPLQRQRKDLPPALCAAIDRALRTSPAERGTLADLGDALEDALTEVADDGGTIARHPLERPGLLPPVPRGAPRIAHALGTAALAGGSLAAFGAGTGVPPLAVAAAAAAVTALLPRLGWIATAIATVAVLGAAGAVSAAPDAVAAPGSAALLGLAAVSIPFVLARLPRAWSAPAAAPLLGAVGLAGAYPAIAGRAPYAHQRAILGALGGAWLLLAEALADRTLLLGPATGAPAGGAVQGALSIAADAVGELITAGLPVLLVIWAAGAVVLPWLVRGRYLAWDIVAASAWAAGLASATAALVPWLGDALPVQEPKGLIAGALVAGVGAVAGARMGHFAHVEGE